VVVVDAGSDEVSGRDDRMDAPATSWASSWAAATAADASAVTWATMEAPGSAADADATEAATGPGEVVGPVAGVPAAPAGPALAGAGAGTWGAGEVATWALPDEPPVAPAVPPAPDGVPVGVPVGVPDGVAVAVPSGAVLVAVGLEVCEPVAPVGPVSPLVERGVLRACEVASPVSPELVELALAVAEPELPVVADGLTETLELPPAPPLAEEAPVDEPPPLVDVWAAAGPAIRTIPATEAAARRARRDGGEDWVRTALL
jgi:hypothetical protein